MLCCFQYRMIVILKLLVYSFIEEKIDALSEHWGCAACCPHLI